MQSLPARVEQELGRGVVKLAMSWNVRQKVFGERKIYGCGSGVNCVDMGSTRYLSGLGVGD